MNNHLFSPVTKEFLQAVWEAQEGRLTGFLHSYVYARWPYLYISIASGEHPLARMLAAISRAWKRVSPRRKSRNFLSPSVTQASGTPADIYHGKVMPYAPARELLSVNQPINLPDLEQVIPYVRARAIIQQHPDRILAVQCPCRLSRKNPCLPLDVCLVFGEPFASFTIQHYPDRARWISPEEASEILEREDARGRVHHAFFAEMMLGRMFAICNCCSCCCTAIQAHQRGTPMLASSGYVAQVDSHKCSACNTCESRCNFGALRLVNGSTAVDDQLCMGCGVCVSNCPQGAISLRREAAKGTPLDILELIGS